jgi:hypothetical protein
MVIPVVLLVTLLLDAAAASLNAPVAFPTVLQVVRPLMSIV